MAWTPPRPESPNHPDNLPRTTDPDHKNADFPQDKKPAGFPPPSKKYTEE